VVVVLDVAITHKRYMKCRELDEEKTMNNEVEMSCNLLVVVEVDNVLVVVDVVVVGGS